MFIKQCSFWSACRSSQMAWDIRKWQEGHTGWPYGPLWYILISSDRVSTLGMVDSQLLAYVGDLNMAWQRAHLLHMPLVFNSEPYIGCQKCDTVVGSTTAPRYTEELPATELGLVSWAQELKHMGLNTEMNYYYHLPHITLLRSQ